MNARLIALLLLLAAACPVVAASAPTPPRPQGIIVVPDLPVAVAPNQPPVNAGSTAGIINALCEVKLNIVGCGFLPTAIAVTCDTNGDGVPELSIPLKNITFVNGLLTQATLEPLSPGLPGTVFPLACCGGIAGLTLTRTLGAGDDNVFGETSQSATCAIDLGLRAPVVISAAPSDVNCSGRQTLVIPGSCFIQPDGQPNVTSVFAVERGNPSNVIRASRFVIVSNNFINAEFEFGPASAGKSFLIFASGPNGTSRNLSVLPEGAPEDCPLGNEQGVQVTVACLASSASDGDSPPPPFAFITSCRLKRSPSGVITLEIFGNLFRDGVAVTINGVAPKKLKLKDFNPSTNTYLRITAKGRICNNLPGLIVAANPGQPAGAPFQCNDTRFCRQ